VRPATESRLVAFLDRVEGERKANGDKLERIASTVERNSDTLGQLADEIAEVKGEVLAQSGRIEAVEDRLEGVEETAGCAVEATGRHELQRVADQLATAEAELCRQRESASHWRRYVITSIVGLLVMLASGVVGYLMKGNP